jgi:ABC-2 type transport system permease protein
MSLLLLFRDELTGFYRSKVMVALWVGLPALSLLLYAISPNTGSIPVAVFTSLLVGSIGGTLASAMLAVSIINERERHVYDLFVIRPVRRSDLLLAKFLAVYVCVIIASLLALAVGLVADAADTGLAQGISFAGLATSTILLVSLIAISCSAGIVIGVVSPSVLVGVILVLYGGNQLGAVVLLPALLYNTSEWFPLLPGTAITVALLAVSIRIFQAREF